MNTSNQRYGSDVQQFLKDAGYKVGKSVVPPGDTSKSLHVLEHLVTDALHFGLDRNGVVLALGGGMIGDLAGFLSASYMRGVRFVQLPTTLLAHDSSVGGKVAVNHPLAKNVIGAFHQPVGVIYDTTTLATLPKRELTSGFAEVIKHGLIRDVTLLELLEEKRDQLVGLESPYIDRAILKGCRIKAEVVSRDEKEHGLRAVLNYGHTIGHAVEALADFGRLIHGESIAIGMVGEAMIGERLGTVKEDIVTLTKELLRAYGLPTTLPPYLAETAFWLACTTTKKPIGQTGYGIADRLGASGHFPEHSGRCRFGRTKAVEGRIVKSTVRGQAPKTASC